MERMLIVGDYHATADSLDECRKLMDYIAQVAKTQSCKTILFMGDQTHTHAILHLEVMRFWMESFKALKDAGYRVIALVGNHDKPGQDNAVSHSMMPVDHIVDVVDRPVREGHFLYLPYYASNEEFIAVCNEHPDAAVVFCHQEFDGSRFENGFYSQNGVDANKLPQPLVISGHIHAQQEFGKVWYVGAPRWRTLSDANQERAIWVVEFNSEGKLVSRQSFSTAEVCRPIYFFEDTPDKPAELPSGEALVTIDVRGPADYVERRKRELEAAGVRVRTFPESQKIRVRESDGIPVAFKRYTQKYVAKNGTSPEVLLQMASERISWMKS